MEKRPRGRPKGVKNDIRKSGTEEIAKNFEMEVSINCTVCQQVYKLSECLKEEPMSAPYETVVEGFLLCPSCGDRKHSYYLPEYVRFYQNRMSKALKRYHENRDSGDWTEYRNFHSMFKRSFDSAQKKYSAIFGKETAGGPGG